MRIVGGAAVLCAVILSVCTPLPAGADTASDLADARSKASAADAAFSAAAAELGDINARFEALGAQIDQLQANIKVSQDRIAVLKGMARDRAVFAYMHGAPTSAGLDIGTKQPLQVIRREELLKHANQKDDRAVRQLGALQQDLAVQQAEARDQRDAQKVLKDQADVKFKTLQVSLAEAIKARDALSAKLAGEQEAAAVAERARLAAATPVRATNLSPGQVLVNPGGGPFQCPVRGAAYGDDYGPRGGGFHYGIDMVVGAGTPMAAVKAGTVHYVPNEGAGGNATYLYANDGNTYYYAHASAFVGGDRSVSQGEVIALVGMTGNAAMPHLHFEIRIGGPNGGHIDPYPTLRSAGC